jgi:Bacterial PH domain
MDPVPTDITRILGPNEQVQLFIKEKIYHPKFNVDSIVLTNQRIILRHPHALGMKKDYTDYSYADIANAIFDKGLLRSSVKCVLRFGGDPLQLGDLPNSAAEKAYGLIRENIARFQNPLTVGAIGMAPVSYPAYQQQASMAAATAVAGVACKKCGGTSAPGSKFCSSCGQSL